MNGNNRNENLSQRNNGEKGYSLEYMVTGLFQSQGYLARRSIPLQYGPINQDATDIDVLGIQFTLPFKGHRIICDCKNKQKSKPYERIFWAKGLGEFTKATDVYVALPKTSGDIINFALTGGVRVLTNDRFSQFSNTPSGSYGTADEKFYKTYSEAIDRVVKIDKQAERMWLTVRKLYLKEDPYTSLNIAFDFLETATKQLNLTKHHSINSMFWKYICCELVVLIGLQVLWICADTYSLPERAREDRILSKLTYGELESSQVHQLLNSASDLANEIVRANVPPTYLPKSRLIEFGEFPPPQYSYSLIGLVERALQNPQWYVDMPQLLDFLLFEQGLKGKDFSDNAYRVMFRSGLSDEKLKASKNILSFIKDNVGFEWKMIWSNPAEINTASNTKSTPMSSKQNIGQISNEIKNEKTNNYSQDITSTMLEVKNDNKTPIHTSNDKQLEMPLDAKLNNNTDIHPIKEHSLALRKTVELEPLKFFNDDFLSKYTKYKNFHQLLSDNKLTSYSDISKMRNEERDELAIKVSHYKKWDDILDAAMNEILEKRINEIKK
ncbi:hypothetical protein [Cohnella cholangitidis]|uniref:Uncharacterized protein n=1 Tax=Cohnella cholangitidis TaxID=2598458 RepID=A0A7G5C0D4_9BACL|nr:hypothetical protein [Cohnella cholangitidis]QMV42668.1 hypothetical protein FPL14_16840 [Cohnella cholangitidis]